MSDYTLNDLNAVSELSDDDLMHIRNTSGLDKKIRYFSVKNLIERYVLRRKVVSTPQTLTPNRRYIVTEDVDLIIPGAVKGDTLDILAEARVRLIQNDPDQIVTYQKGAVTTKGVEGYITLEPGEHLRMTYNGPAAIPKKRFTKLPDPDIIPPAHVNETVRILDISRDATYFIYSGLYNTNPPCYMYKRVGDTVTQMPDLPDLPTIPMLTVMHAKFSPDSTYLVLGFYLASNPKPENMFVVYKRSGDTFTKLPDPVTPLGQHSVYSMDFSRNGRYLVIGFRKYSSYTIAIYKRSGDTFTKLPDPDTVPQNTPYSIKFSYDDKYLAMTNARGSGITRTITIYKRSGDTFTKLPDPSYSLGYMNFVSFSSDGAYLMTTDGASGSKGITLYRRVSDYFIKIDPSGISTGAGGSSVLFSSDGTYLTQTIYNETTTGLHMYLRSGDTFLEQPESLFIPTNEGYTASRLFSPDSCYLAMTGRAPNVMILYRMKEVVDKVWTIDNFQLKGFDVPETGVINKLL